MEFDFYVTLRKSGTKPVESFKNRLKTQKEVRQAWRVTHLYQFFVWINNYDYSDSLAWRWLRKDLLSLVFRK